ncbi:MAG: hypothetical protein K1000chlam2_00613 [Chlamydiae bacterium]|nr:hypothetical protein [Chlamydiota bacterium]
MWTENSPCSLLPALRVPIVGDPNDIEDSRNISIDVNELTEAQSDQKLHVNKEVVDVVITVDIVDADNVVHPVAKKPTNTLKRLKKMKKLELQDLCEKEDLGTAGTRPVLIARLRKKYEG